MSTIIMLSAGGSAILIAYAIAQFVSISRLKVGNKQLFDAGNEMAIKLRRNLGRELSVLGIASAVMFIIVLYLLGWKIALAFLIGALAAIAINRLNAAFTSKSYSCLLDLARNDQAKAGKRLLALAGASSLAAYSSALIVSLIFYAIFKDVTLLFALAFGAAITEIAIRLNLTQMGSDREMANEAGHSSAGLMSAIYASTAIISYYVVVAFADAERATYFSFAFLALGGLSVLVCGLFAGIKAGSRFISHALTKYLFPAILTLAGSYFLVGWTLKTEGSSSIYEFISVSIGIVVPLLLMLAGYALNGSKLAIADSRLFSHLKLGVLAVASILAVYAFSGYFGLGFLALAGCVYLIPVMADSRTLAMSDSAEHLRRAAGLEIDLGLIKAGIGVVGSVRKSMNSFLYYLGIVVGFAALAVFVQKIGGSSNLSFADPYLFGGLILGGLAAYYIGVILSGAVKHGIIVPLAVLIVISTLVGIFLGIPSLIGLAAGFMLVTAISAASFDLVALSVAGIGLLSSAFIFASIAEIVYGMKAKLIVGIVVVVLVLGYIFARRLGIARNSKV